MSELRALVQQRVGQFLDLSGAGQNQRVGQRSDAPRRRIENFEAECTVTEEHSDELTITEHPVEYGAAINDHAFKRPSEVRVRIGWTAAYTGGDVRTIYEQLLALQGSRQPFEVFTGKRAYRNMLVASLTTQTNSGLEYTFLADVVLRQIILVSTQTIPISANINTLANPEGNMPTGQTGTLQTTPASLGETKLARGLGAPDASVDLSKPEIPLGIGAGLPEVPSFVV
jgi:hypothetical protein